jgi:hypothetical protein
MFRNAQFTDGRLHEVPIFPRALQRRPFANAPVPDVATVTYEQHYWVIPDRWSPAIDNRTGTTPDTFTGAYLGPLDVAVATAYLVWESEEPERVPGDLWKVRRIFAVIPADQLDYTSDAFARPRLHDLAVAGGLGTVWAVSFDDESSHLFFSRSGSASLGAVSGGTSVAVAAEAFGTLPASTFTISDGTNSVSPTLNNGASSIQFSIEAALSLLTSVEVSSTPDAVTITWTGRVEYVSTSATGVTMEGGAGTDGSVTFRANKPSVTDTQSAAGPKRTVTVASHGGNAGDLVALFNGNRLVATAKVISAAGGSFVVAADSGPLAVADTVVDYVAFAKNGLRIIHGTKEDCDLKRTTRFYLPGVTSGISSGASLPPVQLYRDPIAWLGRIVATTHTGVTATASNDRLTKTAHGLSTGDTCFLLDLGTGGAGLATLTQYWAIRVDADNFKVATSPDNALAGTAVDITSDSTGAKVLVPAPWVPISVAAKGPWMGPIYQRTINELQMADALETRSASV